MPKDKEEGKEEVERVKVLGEVVKSWNSLILSLLKVKSFWDRYKDLIIENQVGLEEFSVESQRILMKANPKGDFDFIIEDLLNQGKYLEDFLKTQFIKLKEEKAEPSKGD